MELVKFIPPDQRLEMAQDIIEETGIRPLAREIEVNPKSVYKYKEGQAHPGNEVMKKIMAVIEREDPDLLEEHLDRLRKRFEDSFYSSIDSEEVLSGPQEGSEVEAVDAETEAVDSEETGEKPEESVSQQSTEKVSMDFVWESIGVSTPFNRMKVEKIIDALDESSELQLSEIEEMTSVSGEAIESYLEELISEELVEEVEPGVFSLEVRVEAGD